MLLDARQLPEAATLDCDVCIVGAGAAGITIARELAAGRIRVCLVESGGFGHERGTQRLYRGDPGSLYAVPLDESRFRWFGGSTNRWAGWCRELDPQDFEKRQWVADSGWPFGIDTLAPFYERARAVCEVDDSSIGARPEIQVGNELCLSRERIVSADFRLSPPTMFARKYGDELLRAPNVQVCINANAVELEPQESFRRIDRLTCSTLERKKFSVAASAFVLATGGIENARLLLVSGAANRHAIGNEHDLVGRYYMDHPAFFSGTFDPAPECPPLGRYTTRHIANPAVDGRATSGLSLDPRVLSSEELLNAVVRFVPQPEYRLDALWDSAAVASGRRLAASLARGTMPEHRMTHALRAAAGIHANVVALARLVRHTIAPRQQLALRCFVEPAPDRDNRVTLAARSNSLGERVASVRWVTGEAEKRSAIRLHEILGSELRRAGFGTLEPVLKTPHDEWPISQAGAFHHMGTTRMNNSPRLGVVDSDCQVHGVSNLFIAGSSVFPTGGYANPTLTIVALALRLADKVRVAS